MTRAAHAVDTRDVARELGSDVDSGLSASEAAERLARFGPNRLARVPERSQLKMALDQLLDPLVALLIGATVISVAIGETIEGIAIAAIVFLNGALGYWQELGAARAIRALSETFTRTAVVVRDGREVSVPAHEVVPGDLLVIGEGDRIAADARIVETRLLDADESALTGESLPVAKQAAPVEPASPLAERASMVYAGTSVTRGRARALVCATGGETEIGEIERLTSTAQPPPTPLALRLGRLARQMVAIGVAITLVLGAAMLLRGNPLSEAALTAIAVAVAAVPEGLAAIVTASLALGGRAMARRGAIVRRLSAIETLGETTVICTDKTGTLTQNEIRVAALRPADGFDELQLLEAATLASTARTVGGGLAGDPVEQALVLAAAERGLSQADLLAARDLVFELPFESDRKRMTLVYAEADSLRAYTKGAPETVAEVARSTPHDLLETAAHWAGEGLRVLVVAHRVLDRRESLDEGVEQDLEPIGVVALHDPLRANAAASVAQARAAGISVRMITGDHPATARTIGRALGLPEELIVARATPADKLELVEALQAAGEIVAVTGDGVNDAPALRRADVGVAMGRGGTETAREAAAVVLTDDDFGTIVAAIAEGRRIGDNIRKFVAFLLSANFGEVIVFAAAIGIGLGNPLAVIQVLVVNLVTDGLPALALARDPASAATMSSPPRRGALFGRLLWALLGAIGVLVGAASFAAFLAGRGGGDDVAQTMAFATLALAELALVFGIRSLSLPAWRLPGNRWLVWSTLVSAALVVALVFTPFAADAFATTALSPSQSAIVLALALVPLAGLELIKAVVRRTGRHAAEF